MSPQRPMHLFRRGWAMKPGGRLRRKAYELTRMARRGQVGRENHRHQAARRRKQDKSDQDMV